MGCKCGSQIILCNLPVRFDTYRGCSHGCRYCFAQKKNDISHIERDESVDGLRSFIEGKRGNETEWCDWNIPIHWGGMSDPFQPVEKQIRASYECLKLLAETKYPFVVSTKGRLVADPEYLDLLAQCNCVLQISMVCSKYDRLERGTPSYEERLAILKTVSARVQRTGKHPILDYGRGASQPGTELKVRRGGQCRIGPKTTFGSVNRAKARRPTRHLPSTETWAQTGAYGSLPNSYPRVTRLSSVGAARKSGENAAERMTTIWMT